MAKLSERPHDYDILVENEDVDGDGNKRMTFLAIDKTLGGILVDISCETWEGPVRYYNAGAQFLLPPDAIEKLRKLLEA